MHVVDHVQIVNDWKLACFVFLIFLLVEMFYIVSWIDNTFLTSSDREKQKSQVNFRHFQIRENFKPQMSLNNIIN